MGITIQGLEFLLSARRRGVDFSRTMTIGRQFLLVPPERLAQALAVGAGDRRRPFPSDPEQEGLRFAEPLLRHLGAEEACSMDSSDFEQATHIHDLNRPVPEDLRQRFSVVLDGGCLEHIFDFPTAMRNCMEMVEVGGHLLCMPPANNAVGHGFYQFSPDLYFRVLSPENGFEVEQMLLAEVRPNATWYRLVDPAVAGRRIEFTTKHQAYLYVQARRIDGRPPLLTAPVQSDYNEAWSRAGDEPVATRDEVPDIGTPRLSAAVESLRRTVRCHPTLHVPLRSARRAVAHVRRHREPYDPIFFQRIGRHLR